MVSQKSFIGKEIAAESLKMFQDFQQISNWQNYAYWMFEDQQCNPDCVMKGSEECKLLKRIKKCSEYSGYCIVISRYCKEALIVASGGYTPLQNIIDPLVYTNFEFTNDNAFAPEDAKEICRFNFNKHLKYMEME